MAGLTCTSSLDWGSKKLVGCHLSRNSRTVDWIDALNSAVNTQFPAGIRSASNRLMLLSDNGCQPSSGRFAAETRLLGIQQIFTSYNNPKGNAETERVIRSLKVDLVCPRDFETFVELVTWGHEYNYDSPHSALGYQTPYAYET